MYEEMVWGLSTLSVQNVDNINKTKQNKLPLYVILAHIEDFLCHIPFTRV